MNIVGIAGRASAGKSTAADVLVKEFGFVTVALSDPMKRACAEWFGWDEDTLWGPSEKRNVGDPRFPRHAGMLPIEGGGGPMNLTPRYALQMLGTEFGRRCYEDVWVDYAMRIAKRLFEEGRDWGYPGYDPRFGIHTGAMVPTKGIAVPDLRFKNEVDAIRAAGGRVWLITRPSTVNPGEAWRSHSSEKGLDGSMFEGHIHNDGSLVEFQERVARLAHKNLGLSR